MIKKFIYWLLVLVLVFTTGQLLYLFIADNTDDIKAVGGTWQVAVIGKVASLNPVISPLSERDWAISKLVYAGLMSYDPRQASFKPDLAEKISYSRDMKVITVRLRDDISWQDGEMITANDIMFTYGILQNPRYPDAIFKGRGVNFNKLRSLSIFFKKVTLEKIDDRTVRFTLAKAYNYFDNYLTIGLLPSHLWRNIALIDYLQTAQGQTPIGSGAFAYDKVRVVDGIPKLFLKRFKKYYHAANIDELVVWFFANGTDLVTTLSSNNGLNITQILGLDFDFIGALAGRFNFYPVADPSYLALFFNNTSPYFKDRKFRQIISMSLDKDLLLKNLDNYHRTDFPMADNNVIFNIFNISTARKLLNDLGWKLRSSIDGNKSFNLDQIIAKNTLLSSDKSKIKTQVKPRIKSSAYGFSSKENPLFTLKKELILSGKGHKDLLKIYINDYKLSAYNNTKSIWYYTASKKYKTISYGKNTYRLEGIFQGNKQKKLLDTLVIYRAKNSADLAKMKTKYQKNLKVTNSGNTSQDTKKQTKQPVIKNIISDELKVTSDHKSWLSLDDKTCSLKMIYPNKEPYLNLATSIKSQIETNIACQVKLTPLTEVVFKKQLAQRDYDFVLFNHYLPFSNDLIPFWHSTSIKAGANFANFSTFRSDVALELLTYDKNYYNQDKQKSKIAEFHKIFSAELPAFIIAYPQTFFGVKKSHEAWVNFPKIHHLRNLWAPLLDVYLVHKKILKNTLSWNLFMSFIQENLR